jgi:hypothetical protein
MSEGLEPLILDLVAWVARQPRPYADVMDAWRTSCPRLTVWEDAVDMGVVSRAGEMVTVTRAGKDFLHAHGRDIALAAAPRSGPGSSARP